MGEGAKPIIRHQSAILAARFAPLHATALSLALAQLHFVCNGRRAKGRCPESGPHSHSSRAGKATLVIQQVMAATTELHFGRY